MNMENLELIFKNYIAKFDEMNDAKHNETYKWVAVEHFRKSWDIDASNFAAMFKESISKTDNLINNSKVLPTSGIVRLAKRDPDAARTLFRNLFRKDDGNLQERQERIDRFVSEANAMLETFETGSTKYLQDRRAAIIYLNLRYPDENYMFKSTEAKKFADCIEYDDSWGSGKYFKLGKYYKMCDNLVKAIEENLELLSTHRAGRKFQKFEDRKHHILAYDIIYCASQYGLYENIVIRPKKSKISKSSTVEISQTMMVEFQTQRDALQAELSELDAEKGRLEDVSVKGMTVTHKAFGPGLVLEHDGPYLVVKFEKGDKKFVLPDAFSDGYLVTEDPKIMERYALEAEVLKKMSNLQMQLKTLETRMKKAEA